MSSHALFTEPNDVDFLVVGDFEPDWGTLDQDPMDHGTDMPELERITPDQDPDAEPVQEPRAAQGPNRRNQVGALVERGVMAVRRRTRRIYAEGLPVVFGPAPADSGY